MSRLTDMAEQITQALNYIQPTETDVPELEERRKAIRRSLMDTRELLRAASARTVGTEWNEESHPYVGRIRHDEHNAEIHAARLTIADLKAERDEATKMAYMIIPGDERNPGVTWREAYEILDEKALGEKHGHACAMSTLAEQHNAALASLAEKQRAIDEAFAVLDAGHGMLACREAAHILRPHATKATEGQIRTAAHYTPSEIVANIDAIVDKVTEAKPPRQWTSTPPKNRSGKWWHSWLSTYSGVRLYGEVPWPIHWEAALRNEGGELWLPWQEGDTADNLPPPPTEATPATTQPTAVVTPVGSGTTPQVSPVGNDDTRELAVECCGMSLRDWHASRATEADVKHWLDIFLLNGMSKSREECKYAYADAMLAARKAGVA